MSKSQHVPTPYTFEYRDWRGQPSIHAHISGNAYEHDEEDEDGNPTGETTTVSTSVAIVLGNATSEPVTRDTAAFLYRAANCHASLLAALETMTAMWHAYITPDHYDGHAAQAYREAMGAIRKAKGECA